MKALLVALALVAGSAACSGITGLTSVVDAGAADSGPPEETADAGLPDAGLPDAGVADAGAHDAGTPDAGIADAGAHDAGVPDAGGFDAGNGDAGAADAGTPGAGSVDWPVYRGNVMGQSYLDVTFPASQGKNFSLSWTYKRAEASYANPIIEQGVVYLAWGDGTLRAVDVKSGSDIWSAPIGITPPSGCGKDWGAPVGAPAVVGKTVFASGGDGKVYAFDRQSGSQLWATPVADLTQNEFLWTSIFPLHGKVYVAVATLDETNCPTVAGRAVSLDQTSGQIVATWWDTSHSSGGGIWTQPVYDSASNRLFYTTGNAVGTASSEPYAQAIVAVDADTLQVVDSYQVTAASGADEYDFGASPTLFDTSSGQHLIAGTNKDGIVYALDRNNLAQGTVWQYQLNPGGPSPDDGRGSIVSAVFGRGLLLVAGGQTADGYPGVVAALDPSSGQEQWKMNPDGFVLPSLLGFGDVLIAVASHSSDMTGRIYAIDLDSGSTLWTYATPGVLFAPPSFAEGTLLVPDAAGNVYAFCSSP